MLKAHVEHDTWLTQQHHHAQVSGFLAAHWGGVNGFARPGSYPGSTQPERWRDEVVLGIAEHDNGWWETEAMPRLSDRDGLPVGVGEAAPPTDANEFTPWITGGFERWSNGINRLAGAHPYGALLISLHAYWLYAVAFDDLQPDDEDAFRHFVFGPRDVAAGLIGDEAKTRAFLAEQRALQESLIARLGDDESMAGAVQPGQLLPHVRLLQLLDSMSLYLALNDLDDHVLEGVPRGSWGDRVSMTWTRLDARTIALDPYPFDVDDLRVLMPTRVVTAGDGFPESSPMARLHGQPLESIEFRFTQR